MYGERTVSADDTEKETETRSTYEYDNVGNRIQKKVTTAGTTVVTDDTYYLFPFRYLRGAEPDPGRERRRRKTPGFLRMGGYSTFPDKERKNLHLSV